MDMESWVRKTFSDRTIYSAVKRYVNAWIKNGVDPATAKAWGAKYGNGLIAAQKYMPRR